MAGPVSKPELRLQLDRILRSGRFVRAWRPAKVLEYLGGHILRDHVPSESEIAINACDLPENCDDDTAHSIVVGNLRRLRGHLEGYYANEGAQDPVLINVPVRTIVAEPREETARATADPLAELVFHAGQAFFVAPEETAMRCVVTGEATGIAWYPLDGNPYKMSMGNLVPLSRELRSVLDAVWQGRRSTLIEKLSPRRLGNKLAPLHFRQLRPASAYGCVVLAFHLSALPHARQPDHVRAAWLCDAISYARRHFSEPLVRHVLSDIAWRFLAGLKSTDAVTALRVTLQLTGVFEEIGRNREADACLDFGERLSRSVGRRFFEGGTSESFGLARRRAQLLAERNPNDENFKGLIAGAQEHSADIEERVLSLQIDRLRRWLRQGSPDGLESACELSGSVLEKYETRLFTRGTITAPERIAAHLGEISLLSAIATCRRRPGRWKPDAQEMAHSAQTLIRRAGHVLPVEYTQLVLQTAQRFNAKSGRVLRLAGLQSRPTATERLVTDVSFVLEALTKLRVLPVRHLMPDEDAHPDL